jgi:hypothetical protein
MGQAIHTNLQCALLAMRYAKFQGVKHGQSFAKQLEEVMIRHPEWVSKVEKCKEDDPELYGANEREKGKKVFILNEYLRQLENKKKGTSND